MSEFKFVQWGAGIPNDYQRLNAMMINDQYLKDKLDPSPRGMLMWKSASTFTIDPTGGYQNITGFENLTFDVEASRLISFEFNSGPIYTGTACEYRVRFVIDGVSTSNCGGGGAGASPQHFGASLATYTTPSALTQGSHTVTVQIIATGAVSDLRLGYDGIISLKVRDEGAFLSASS